MIPKLAQALESQIMDAYTDIAAEGVRLAVRRSSGGFSKSALRKMDSPYAKRHASPLLDPSTINMQTGKFAADWDGHAEAGGAKIINDNEVADFLDHGTKTMHRRPIREAVELELQAFAESRMDEAVSAFEDSL